MKNDDPTKEQALTFLVPVIQSPELIKVRTISPKVVDQLPWRGHPGQEWTSQEIIGRIPQSGTILLRHSETGQLSRAADLAYLEARTVDLTVADENDGITLQEARDQANRELRLLPQIFAI